MTISRMPISTTLTDVSNFYYFILPDWEAAQKKLTACLEMHNDESTCLAMSEFMEQCKDLAPSDWPGYRNIDFKEAAPSMSFSRPPFDEDNDDDEDIDENESLS
jgi:hypothetical protein